MNGEEKHPPSRCWVYAIDKMEELDKAGRIVFSSNGYPRYKRYLDENLGEKITDIWSDIFQLSSQESLGYPTQKPVSLLERIVEASSNEGDVILDPFCGCGTAIIAAEKMQRKWIGVDVTSIATTLVQKRLFDSFNAREMRIGTKNETPTRVFEVKGLPKDLTSAKALYDKDPLHKDFEMWAVSLVPAFPQDKKGADGGIDGVAYFNDNPKKPSKAIIQVKGGHVNRGMIDALRGVMQREKAQMGFFITLETPSAAMLKETLHSGYYQPPSGVGRRVQAMQIRTIEELLNGTEFDVPLYGSNVTFKQAGVVREGALQATMDLSPDSSQPVTKITNAGLFQD